MTIYSEEKPEYIKTNGLKVFSRYFKFEIANPQTNATGDASGFIDALKPQDYADYDSSAGTVEKYASKARGYIRWLNLSLALSKFGIFFMEVDELTGATALDTPTKITFTVGYEQADEMYAKDTEGNEWKPLENTSPLLPKYDSKYGNDKDLYISFYIYSIEYFHFVIF